MANYVREKEDIHQQLALAKETLTRLRALTDVPKEMGNTVEHNGSFSRNSSECEWEDRELIWEDSGDESRDIRTDACSGLNFGVPDSRFNTQDTNIGTDKSQVARDSLVRVLGLQVSKLEDDLKVSLLAYFERMETQKEELIISFETMHRQLLKHQQMYHEHHKEALEKEALIESLTASQQTLEMEVENLRRENIAQRVASSGVTRENGFKSGGRYGITPAFVEHDELSETLMKENSRLREMLRKYESNDYVRLERKVALQEKLCESYNKDISSKDSLVKRLQAENRGLQEDAKNLQDDILKINANRLNAEQDKTRLRQELQFCEEQISTLREKLGSAAEENRYLQRCINDANTKANTCDGNLSELEKEILALKGKCESYRDKLNDKERFLASVTRENQGLTKTVEAMKKELATVRGEGRSLEAEYERVQRENADREIDRLSSETNSKASSSKISKMKQQLYDLENKVGELENRRQVLEDRETELSQEVLVNLEKYTQAEQELFLTKKQLAQLRGFYDSSDQQRKDLQAEVEDSRHKIAALEKELQKKLNDESEHEMNDLLKEKDRLLEAIQRLREEVDTNKTEIEELEAALQSAREQNTVQRMRLDAHETLMNRKDERIKELQDESVELHNQCDVLTDEMLKKNRETEGLRTAKMLLEQELDLFKTGKVPGKVHRDGAAKDNPPFYHTADPASPDSGFADMEREKAIERLKKEILLHNKFHPQQPVLNEENFATVSMREGEIRQANSARENRRLAETEGRLAEVTAQNELIKDREQEIKNSHIRLEEELRKVRRENSELKEREKMLAKGLGETKFVPLREAQVEQLEETKQKLEDLMSENELLKGREKESKNSQIRMEEELQKVMKENSELKEKENKLTKALEEAKCAPKREAQMQELNKTELRLADMTAENELLKDREQEVENSQVIMEEELREIKKENSELKEKEQMLTKALEETQFDGQAQQLEEIEQKLADLMTVNEILKDREQEVKNSQVIMEEELREVKKENSELKEKEQMLTKALEEPQLAPKQDGLVQHLEETEQRLAELTNENKLLKDREQEIKNSHIQMEEELRKVTKENSELKEKEQMLTKALEETQLAPTRDGLEQQLVETEQKLANLTIENELFEDREQEMNNSYLRMEEELRKVVEENSELKEKEKMLTKALKETQIVPMQEAKVQMTESQLVDEKWMLDSNFEGSVETAIDDDIPEEKVVYLESKPLENLMEFEDKIDGLHSEVLREENSRLQNKTEELEREIEDYEARLEEATADKDQLVSDLKHAQGNIREMDNECTRVQEDKNELQLIMQEELSAKDEEVAKLQKEISELCEERANLQLSVDSSKEMNSQAEEEILKAENTILDMARKEEISRDREKALQQLASQSEESNSTLQAQLSEAKLECREMEKQTQMLRQEMNLAQQSSQELKREIEEIKKRLAEKEKKQKQTLEELKDLERENEQLQEKLDEAHNIFENLQEEDEMTISKLQGSLRRKENEIKQLEDELSISQQRCAEIKTLSSDTQHELSDLHAQLIKSRDQFFTVSQEKARLVHSEKELERGLADKEEKILTYESEKMEDKKMISEQRKKVEELVDKLNDIENGAGKLGEENESLQGDLNLAAQKQHQLERLLEEYNDEKKDLEQQLLAAHESISDLETAFERGEDRTSQLAENLNEAKSRISKLEGQLENSQQECRVLDKARNETEKDFENAQASLDSCQEKLDDLEKKLRAAQENVSFLETARDKGQSSEQLLQEKFEHACETIAKTEEENCALKNKQVKVEKKLGDLISKQDRLEEKKENTEKINRELRKELELEKEKLSALQNDVESKKREKDVVIKKVELLEANIAETEEFQYKDIEEKSKLREELVRAMKNMSELEATKETQEETIFEMEDLLKETRSRITQLEQKMEDSSRDNADLKGQLEELNRKLKYTKEENSDLEKRLQKQKDIIDGIRTNLAEREEAVMNSNFNRDMAESALQSARKDLARKEANLKMQKEHMDEVAAESEKANKKLREAEASYKKLAEENERLLKELADMKEQLARMEGLSVDQANLTDMESAWVQRSEELQTTPIKTDRLIRDWSDKLSTAQIKMTDLQNELIRDIKRQELRSVRARSTSQDKRRRLLNPDDADFGRPSRARQRANRSRESSVDSLRSEASDNSRTSINQDHRAPAGLNAGISKTNQIAGETADTSTTDDASDGVEVNTKKDINENYLEKQPLAEYRRAVSPDSKQEKGHHMPKKAESTVELQSNRYPEPRTVEDLPSDPHQPLTTEDLKTDPHQSLTFEAPTGELFRLDSDNSTLTPVTDLTYRSSSAESYETPLLFTFDPLQVAEYDKSNRNDAEILDPFEQLMRIQENETKGEEANNNVITDIDDDVITEVDTDVINFSTSDVTETAIGDFEHDTRNSDVTNDVTSVRAGSDVIDAPKLDAPVAPPRRFKDKMQPVIFPRGDGKLKESRDKAAKAKSDHQPYSVMIMLNDEIFGEKQSDEAHGKAKEQRTSRSANEATRSPNVDTRSQNENTRRPNEDTRRPNEDTRSPNEGTRSLNEDRRSPKGGTGDNEETEVYKTPSQIRKELEQASKQSYHKEEAKPSQLKKEFEVARKKTPPTQIRIELEQASKKSQHKETAPPSQTSEGLDTARKKTPPSQLRIELEEASKKSHHKEVTPSPKQRKEEEAAPDNRASKYQIQNKESGSSEDHTQMSEEEREEMGRERVMKLIAAFEGQEV